MPHLKLFRHQHAIPSDWKRVQERVIEKGGHRYRVLAQKEYNFSPSARILGSLVCLALAVAAVWTACNSNWTGVGVTSAGSLPAVWLLWRPFKDLVTNAPRKVSLAIFTEEDYRNEQELNQGIAITDQIKEKVAKALEDGRFASTPGVNRNHSGHTGVFSLTEAPNLIFKPCFLARYENMLKARLVVKMHQLDQLVIPRAQFFKVDVNGSIRGVIAEEKMIIGNTTDEQKEQFKRYAPSLSETFRQFAIFICKTGYCDVTVENNPVLINSLDGQGLRKIAILDLDEMYDTRMGLFGAPHRPGGLVGQAPTPELAQIVRNVARENGFKN